MKHFLFPVAAAKPSEIIYCGYIVPGIKPGKQNGGYLYAYTVNHLSLSFTLRKIHPATKATSNTMPTTGQKFHQNGVLAVSVQCQAITAVKAATTTIPVTIQ